MKKAIKSKYTESVTTIERADWSISFYDVETGRHYARRVWYPVHGSDIYVQHRGGFYSIATEFKGKYDPQAISRYEAVSAEELETMTAEIIAHRAGIQYADALTWEEATRVYAYAIVCNDADTEATMTAIVNDVLQDRSKQPAQQATEATRAAADRAARALINAYAEATGETITEDDPETAAAYQVARARIIHNARHQCDEYDYMVDDMVEAIARSVRRHPRIMTEIECTASEAVSQLMSAYAEAIGSSAYDISGDVWQAAYHVAAVDIIPEPERPAGYTEASDDDRATVSDIVDTIARADRYQWTPEETRDNIEYRATIRTANRAAAAFVAAYAEASGENLTEDDDETRAAYLVARDEITGTSERATDYDRAMVAGMVQTIAAAAAYMRPFAVADAAAAAFVAAYAEASGETIAENDPEARTAHLVARAEIAGSHASDYDRAMVRDMLEAIADAAARQAAFKAWSQSPHRTSGELVEAMDNPRAALTNLEPTYQRYELDAYLGDPDAYDVEAIEAEATAYDPKSGARVWVAFGEDLAAIAERHELYEYAPAV